MQLAKAKQIAKSIVERLSPHCQRCEIAGSIRRECDPVKDIEVVCIPKYRTGKIRLNAWVMAVWKLGKIVKGKLGAGKYIQIHLPEGIALDLFVAERDNWGMIYLIRTGSATFSRDILGKFNRKGFKSVGGYPTKGNTAFGFKEEQTVFDFLELGFIDPVNRNI